MKQAHAIIKEILLTEKGTRLKEGSNKYLFRVDGQSNKTEIKRAVENLFSVSVTKVNTLNRDGKLKRDRRMMKYGRTASSKRAVVTLKVGDKIEVV